MSSPSVQQRIRQHPKFAELVARRTRFALVLSLFVLVPYYSFMMVVAFNPALLHQTLGDSVITIAWPLGALLVIGSWLLTGVYIRRANGEFDELTQKVLKEATR
ncbi:DUF485 domain-containing protein [Azospira restricta]|uniref:DUF485 domain-containing protein n=1 Tax=Azospira restricta TaxID=404405 RepID=A0A974SMS4_9RHOO|nr:DUF485 domain-containing protein [Azospira restricta]QRJ62752.1 DUF485 domain-containing protein [Azospira restricta]